MQLSGYSYAIVIALLVSIGCQKFSDDTTINNKSLKAIINGSPQEFSELRVETDVMAPLFISGKNFYYSISISINGKMPGTYICANTVPINETSNISVNDAYDVLNTYSTHTGGSGFISLISFDSSHVKGTFEGVVYNSSSIALPVENGSFEIRYR